MKRKYFYMLFMMLISIIILGVVFMSQSNEIVKMVKSEQIKKEIWSKIKLFENKLPTENVKVGEFRILDESILKVNKQVTFNIVLNHGNNIATCKIEKNHLSDIKFSSHKIDNTFKEISLNDTTKVQMMFHQYNFESNKSLNWTEGTEATLWNNDNLYDFGKVVIDKHNASGLDYKVLKNSDKQDKSSTQILIAGTNDSNNQRLFSNDVTADLAYVAGRVTPSQGIETYQLLLDVLKNSNSDVYITGHSLGGMNIIYALSQIATKEPNYVKRIYADVYEVPNIYLKFTKKEQSNLLKYKQQLNNYVVEDDQIASAFGVLPTITKEHAGNLVIIKNSQKGLNLLQIHNLEQQRKFPLLNIKAN